MKKILSLASLAVFSTGVFAQSSWCWGLTLGSVVNPSMFTGGMPNAPAIFSSQPFEGVNLGVVFRKTCCQHFSIETGLNVRMLGFQYDIAQNYSLNNPASNWSVNSLPMEVFEIPATAIYTSNFDCKNVRWFAGAGISLVMGGMHGDLVNTTNTTGEVNGVSTTGTISQDVHYPPVLSPDGHLVIGSEKQFKCGRMLSCALIFNAGVTPLATSTVSYIADNEPYHHTFTNYGSYIGINISYHFKAFGANKVISGSTNAHPNEIVQP